jgi:hypothetical protein
MVHNLSEQRFQILVPETILCITILTTHLGAFTLRNELVQFLLSHGN